MKHEWRKHEKEIYIPKKEVEIIELPKYNYVTIKGIGNPNSEEFSLKVATLYSVAYGLKMLPKKNIIPEGYFDYTVYPLEGLWDLSHKGRTEENLDKNELVYTLMIRQPAFIKSDHFDFTIENLKNKHPEMPSGSVEFIDFEEGLSVQALHIGSYDDEATTFEKMKSFISENHLKIKTLEHKEIYLSDPRKTQVDKLKTVLRYRVCKT